MATYYKNTFVIRGETNMANADGGKLSDKREPAHDKAGNDIADKLHNAVNQILKQDGVNAFNPPVPGMGGKSNLIG